MRPVFLAKRGQHDLLQLIGGRNDGQQGFLAFGRDLYLDRAAIIRVTFLGNKPARRHPLEHFAERVAVATDAVRKNGGGQSRAIPGWFER